MFNRIVAKLQRLKYSDLCRVIISLQLSIAAINAMGSDWGGMCNGFFGAAMCYLYRCELKKRGA